LDLIGRVFPSNGRSRRGEREIHGAEKEAQYPQTAEGKAEDPKGSVGARTRTILFFAVQKLSLAG